MPTALPDPVRTAAATAATPSLSGTVRTPPPPGHALRALAGAAEPWHEVTVDGVRLAFDDDGDGEAIVCTHAIGHGAGDFAPFRARQRAAFRVVALDWPEHGRSGGDRVPPSSARYRDLLAGALDTLGLERVILLGNSIGGAAALRVAAARPELVRAVVAANPGGLVPDGTQKRLVTRALARFFACGTRPSRWYPRAFAALYRRLLSEPPAAEQRARLVAAWAEVAPVLAAAWRSFGEPSDDLNGILPAIACPVLITWSTGDPLNRLSFNRPGIARLPNGRLETFRGGHAPFLECPDAFDAALARFLRDLR